MRRKQLFVLFLSLFFGLLIINQILCSEHLRYRQQVSLPNDDSITYTQLMTLSGAYSTIYLFILIYLGHILIDYMILYLNGLLLVNIAVNILKITVKRKRPGWKNEPGPYDSFPSGHAAFSVAYGAFLCFCWLSDM